MRKIFTFARRFLSLAAVLGLAFAAVGSTQAGAPVAGKPAPAFSLKDTNHHPQSLSAFRGRSVALLFFCGCTPCHQFAALWSQAQAAGQPGAPPMTVVVFSGEAKDARTFAAQTHLDPARTVLLTDPQERVADLYGVSVCPRVFALDPRGVLSYTNNEPGSDPQKTPAVSLVSRMLTALGKSQEAHPSAAGKATAHVP